MQPPKKKPTVLTRLRIDEVSLVDKGAGQGCKIVISKRDELAGDNRPVEMPEHERRYWAALGATALRHVEERFRKEQGTGHADPGPEDTEPEIAPTPEDDPSRFLFSRETFLRKTYAADARGDEADDHDEEVSADELVNDGNNSAGSDGGNDHPAHKVADLLVQSGSHNTHEDALAYLLHNPRGAAMLRRLSKSEESIPMNPTDKLRDIAKRYGIGAIAKSIVEDDHAYSINEHEFASLVVECAVRDNPNLTEAQAFTKVFTEQSEAGVILRKAFNVVKSDARADSVTSYPFPKF